MSTRLLSLVLLIAAFTLLWAMTPRRRRRRRRRRVDLEAMRQSLAYGGSSEAHDRYRIASEKVASGEWVDSSSERRRHSTRRSRRRRPTRRWVVAIGAMLGITVVVGVLVSADVKPFSTFVERYMPSGRSQAPLRYPWWRTRPPSIPPLRLQPRPRFRPPPHLPQLKAPVYQ